MTTIAGPRTWKDPDFAAAVADAVWAPSIHNSQPWRFHRQAVGVDVLLDEDRLVPVGDPDGRMARISCGAAGYNLRLALAVAGRPARFRIGAAGALLHFWPAPPLPPMPLERRLHRQIERRHTNRGPYKNTPVDLDGFAEHSSRIPGAGVLWITDQTIRNQLGALYVEATEAITADTAQSTEAFAWFRNDRGDIDKHRDGLTLDGQGLGAFTLFAAKLLPAQSRTDGDAFWVKATRDVHTATAAAYGVITVDDVTDRTAQVTGGRLLARLHLAATASGLGFHHMNQITERIDRDHATGRTDVFSARWAALLGRPASTGLVSFRVGHPERTPGLSPRRNLTDVTTKRS